MGLQHKGIPMRFGQNSRSCNTAKSTVAFDLATVGNLAPGNKPVTVHQDDAWVLH